MKSYTFIRICVVICAVHITLVHSMDVAELTAQPGAAAVGTEESVKWGRLSSFDEGITSTAAENDARGNWYIKRKFLIDARALYEQIKQRIPQVVATEKVFADMRDAITQEVSAFYAELGVEQQHLDATLTATIESLEQERLKKIQLTEKERDTLADLELTKKELVQVQQDARILADNAGAINQAMTILVQQIKLCEEYEQQAWDKYERIADVLNDHIAEQLYRDIQSYLNHINAIDAYIKGPLYEYFNQAMGMIRSQINGLKIAFNKLQEQGIFFESQAAQELREKQKAHEAAQKQQKEKELTFFGRIISFFKSVGYYIVYPFVWIGNKIASLWR